MPGTAFGLKLKHPVMQVFENFDPEGRLKMSEENIEMMKKIIEEKRKKSSEQGIIPKAVKTIGKSRKALKRNKKSGLFDK